MQVSASAVHGDYYEPGARVSGAAEQRGVQSGIHHAGG